MIIDGKKVAKKLQTKIKEEIEKLKTQPELHTIILNNNSSSTSYLKSQTKIFQKLGINSQTHYFSKNISKKNLEEKIQKLNQKKEINGIMIHLPLPNTFNLYETIDFISPQKDIDCLTSENLSRLYRGTELFTPCTPKSILTLLDDYKIKIKGKNVVILGRGYTVGKPLSLMLLKRDATITLCHSKSKSIREHIKNADILITAIGKPQYIKKDMIKNNVVIIDAGITLKENKILGDVDFNEVKDKAKYITPVPGGVGPLTTTVLAQNLLQAYQNQNIY